MAAESVKNSADTNRGLHKATASRRLNSCNSSNSWQKPALHGVITLLALLLAGCSFGATPTPVPTPAATPLPPIGVAIGGKVATASGEIAPALKAELSFPAAGRIQSIAVETGDAVDAGAVLAVQEHAAAAANVTAAQAALFQAQARLAELRAGPRLQEIAIAQAQLEAAEARLAQLTMGARPEEIAAANSALSAAQTAYQQLFRGPGESERIAALAELSDAEAALRQAQTAYDRVSWRNGSASLPESQALQEATNRLEAVQARYDALYAKPDAAVIAEAQARVQQAKAALERLLAPGSEHQVAEAAATVRSAQAALDLLTAGARDETIASAGAAVTEAEAALRRAEAALDATELAAPFAGTVTARFASAGETVQAGEIVLALADLSTLRAETTDLSERDVARLFEGQPATVLVKPLGAEVPGRVQRIAPQANVVGGDVVYTVVVTLDEQPPGLRWGMSVEVDFLEE